MKCTPSSYPNAHLLQLAFPQSATDVTYQAPLHNADAVSDDLTELSYFVQLSPTRPHVLYPRAQGLGGCTLHHALITSPTFTSYDFDTIGSITGDSSWNTGSMQQIWRGMTNTTYSPIFANPCDHGYHGWLTTSQVNLNYLPPEIDPMLTIPLSAMVNLNFSKTNEYYDPNCASTRDTGGLHVMVKATENGRRVGVQNLIKQTEANYPNNLIVQLNTLVTRVLFDNGVAIGVEAKIGSNLLATRWVSACGAVCGSHRCNNNKT